MVFWGFFSSQVFLWFMGVEVLKLHLKGSLQGVSKVRAEAPKDCLGQRNSISDFVRIDILCLLNYKIRESQN